jgi:hypothetical protein
MYQWKQEINIFCKYVQRPHRPSICFVNIVISLLSSNP